MEHKTMIPNQNYLALGVNYMIRPLALAIGMRYMRAKKRNHFVSFISLSSMLGIGLGVTVLITVLSVMNGFDDEIDPCQFQTINPSIYHFTVQQNTDCNELIYISSDHNLSPIILNYKLLDKCFQRTVYICLLELRDNPDIFPNVWQNMSNMIYNFTCNYIYLIHTKNFKNQAFLYQKQDLVNTISQMASYS